MKIYSKRHCAILPLAACMLLIAASLASCKGRHATTPEPTGDTIEVMADCNRENPEDTLVNRSAGPIRPAIKPLEGRPN